MQHEPPEFFTHSVNFCKAIYFVLLTYIQIDSSYPLHKTRRYIFQTIIGTMNCDITHSLFKSS